MNDPKLRVPDPLFDINGRVLLIAGAGGGLAIPIAQALSARGARLVLFDNDEQKLAAVAKKVPAAITANGDMTSTESIESMLQLTLNNFGRIDGAINAAGVLPISSAASVKVEDFRRCYEINVTAALLFSQAVARAMQVNGGRIVHIASVSSQVANAGYAAYASSKAALSQLVRVLAREWAKDNILVNAIGPALTETPLTHAYLQDPQFRQNALSVIPMGRLGEPEDLLATIVLLLSPGGAFITGQTLYVDGGRCLV